MKPLAASIATALALSAPILFAQDNVLRPFRTADPERPAEEPAEVRRAVPVRRAEPVRPVPPAPPAPTPIPVGKPVPIPATPGPMPEPAPAPAPVPVPADERPMPPEVDEAPAAKPATPRPIPKATPIPQAQLSDPAGEIRISPISNMSPDEAQLMIADGFYARNMFSSSAPEYEKYLGMYPTGAGRAVALFRLGESYRRAGSTNAARNAYQTLLDQYAAGDFIGSAAYRLAEIYYGEKNFTAALPYYRRASVRLTNPQTANAAKFFMARCHEAEGQRIEAKIIYADLVATPKDNPFVDNSRLSLAQILRATGQTAEAQKQAATLAQTADNPELKAHATVLSGVWLIDLASDGTGRANAKSSLLKKAEETLQKALTMPAAERWRDVARIGLVQLAFSDEKYQEVVDAWTKNSGEFTAETQPQAMTLAAKAYAALGKAEESLALFTEVSQKYPKSTYAKDAGYERLKALYRADHESVIQEIDAYVANGVEEERRDLIFLMKAEVLFKRNEFSAAAPLYDYATKSRRLVGNQKAEALGKLAWCYQQTRELDRATKALTELIDGFPTYKGMASVILQRAVCHLRLNNSDGAVKDFRRLIDQYPKAKEREAAILQLGRMLGQRGDSTGMADAFRIYLRDYPKAPEPDRAEANFWIGSVAFENKAYKDAVEPLGIARKLNKTEYFERASLRLMLSRYYLEDADGLAQEIDAYLGGEPKGQVPYEVMRWIGLTYAERGKAALKAGQVEKGVEDHQKALKYIDLLMKREDAKPDDWNVYGQSALAIKDFGAAEKGFTSLLGSVKDPVSRGRALNNLAQSQIGLGKPVEAQTSVEEGLKLQPDGPINAELKISAGDILAGEQKWLDAARMYESVTAIIDDESITPRAGEKAVDCYRKTGEDETAKKLLNRLQSRYPEYFQNKKKKEKT